MTNTERKYYPSIMAFVLKEKEVPPFRLKAKVIPAGACNNHYDPETGKIFKAEFATDFPIMALYQDDVLWMSDTPFEQEGLTIPLQRARGRVLVGGLGLGLFPYLACMSGKVKKVRVIEREQKVIDIIYPQIWHSKLRVTCDDIYHYLSTTKATYDFIYLDVWPDVIGPIEDADKAADLAKPLLRPGGEVRVWLQELIDRVRGKLPTEPQSSKGFSLHEPCAICGKTYRHDYAGLCLDCADSLGVSELFIKRNNV